MASRLPLMPAVESPVLRKLWKRYVVDLRARVDAEIAPNTDSRAVIVLMTAMLCLLMIRFVGMPYEVGRIVSLLKGLGLDGLSNALSYAVFESPDSRLNSSVYWSSWRIVGYVVVPVLIIRFALKGRLEDFGLRIRGTLAYGGVYLIILALIGPLVILASYSPEFQANYPFYQLRESESLWPRFWAWEVLYALQFVSLEFFFRGFLLHGLVRRFGYLSIFVMMAPYMMIHFQKPALEALGSMVAGFVLGTLALESRSIWWGALAHVSVALSMDMLALWHRGFF